MKDIVIVANFVAGLEGKDNNRFSYLANILSAYYDVELIVSDFYHAKKTHRQIDVKQFPFRLTMLHEPGYKKNVCLQRFYSHYVFGQNVRRYLKQRKKPDLIYCAIPSLDAASAAADYARGNGIKFIVDIQDLWPEAFKMVFHVPILSDIIFAPMMCQANRIYKQADEILAVSNTYCQRAMQVNTKCKAGKAVFLGTRLSDFDIFVRNSEKIAKPQDKLWLGYCGTLGSSYDLMCVLRALELLKERGYEPPHFVIMGDGPSKESLERYVQANNLDVFFTGRIPYGQMCGILNACDIVVNPIVKRAAQSVINKHSDYAAAGKAVLNTQESSEYRNLVDTYQMGFNCENGNAEDLAEKLLLLMQSEDLRDTMGRNARRCARERFDRENTYKEILKLIEQNVCETVGNES